MVTVRSDRRFRLHVNQRRLRRKAFARNFQPVAPVGQHGENKRALRIRLKVALDSGGQSSQRSRSLHGRAGRVLTSSRISPTASCACSGSAHASAHRQDKQPISPAKPLRHFATIHRSVCIPQTSIVPGAGTRRASASLRNVSPQDHRPAAGDILSGALQNLHRKVNDPCLRSPTPLRPRRMMQMLSGAYVAGAVGCLAKLGIPDMVEAGPEVG